MTSQNKNEVGRRAEAPWSVVVVYEDNVAREEAVQFCDQLVARFWSHSAVDVSWWSFARLLEALPASEAAGKAVGADLIVFATRREGELPVGVKSWMETWVDRRCEREGTLVGLLDPGPGPGAGTDKYVYLRGTAHRAGLDYLTQMPQDLAHFLPDSIESYSERAEQVTNLLDEILRQRTPPPVLPG